MEKYDEYKLFTEKALILSERRQKTTQTYLAVNTAIFGITAFIVKDTGLTGGKLIAVSLPLFIVGAISCYIWAKIIHYYKEFIGWHYELLRNMELEIEGSNKIYTQEWEKFYKSKKSNGKVVFSNLEAWLPRMLLLLYAVYFFGLLLNIKFLWL